MIDDLRSAIDIPERRIRWLWSVHAHGNRHAMARARPRSLHGDGPGFGGRRTHPTATAAAASATKARRERHRERRNERDLPQPLRPQESLRATPIQDDQKPQQQPRPRQGRRQPRLKRIVPPQHIEI